MLEWAKFRKRPIVIDAVQFDGTVKNAEAIEALALKGGVKITDSWISAKDDRVGLNIPTLEGTMHATRGDWIIRGIKGELYPCKPDIFAASYESADEATEKRIVTSMLEIKDWNAVKSVKFFSCPHDPQSMCGKPIGQYHCPVCGAMVLACCDHPAMVLINDYYLDYDGEEYDKWRTSNVNTQIAQKTPNSGADAKAP